MNIHKCLYCQISLPVGVGKYCKRCHEYFENQIKEGKSVRCKYCDQEWYKSFTLTSLITLHIQHKHRNE